jgi:hypothetical protein
MSAARTTPTDAIEWTEGSRDIASLSKVTSGAADAGIVFATDVRVDSGRPSGDAPGTDPQ